MREIQHVAVVGGGLMGNGIAQVCATAGLDVVLQDVDQSALERARGAMETSLGRLARAGRVDAGDVAAILGRVRLATELADAAAGAELVIEAVPEDLELKRSIFARLDEHAPAQAVLATNTSNLSVTAVAAATKRPEQVIGMHWFNPPPVMRLIEIVRGVLTSDETLAAVVALSGRLGKETVVCKDAQGFITTRLASALVVEAFRMLDEGVGTKEDIDKAIKLGLNHPMGPFELIDLTGLDTSLRVADALVEAYGDRFRASTTLRNMVRAGRFGRKVGKGMYDYS
jgi:3-hydroxybutyryl-CoA dehydrogenase